MNRMEIRTDLTYAEQFPETGASTAFATIREALLDVDDRTEGHRARLAELDAEIAALKADIEEIRRNGTGAGVSG